MKLNITLTENHFFVLFFFDDYSGSAVRTMGARLENTGTLVRPIERTSTKFKA